MRMAGEEKRNHHAQSDADHHHPGFRRLCPQRAVGAGALAAGEPGRAPPRLRAREQAHPGGVGGGDRRAHPRHEVHRRQAQRIYPLLRPAGRLLAGRHDQRRPVGHALLGAGTLPHRGRARARQRRRPVARPGRRAAGGERPRGRPKGRAGQGHRPGDLAEQRQRTLCPAGRRPGTDQLSRAAHGGRRRQLRLLDRASGLLQGARRRSRAATCCGSSAATPGGRPTST